MNIFSLDLILEGGYPKPYYITQKTEKSGVWSGFITQNLNFKTSKNMPEGFAYRKITLTQGNGCAINNNVLYYKNSIVTSDLDIVFVARAKNDFPKKQNIYFEQEMGYICSDDLLTLRSLNVNFRKKLFLKSQQKIYQNIVRHGALNCCPFTKLADLNFPMCVYMPNKIKYYFGNKIKKANNIDIFRNLYKYIRFLGYECYIPEIWK